MQHWSDIILQWLDLFVKVVKMKCKIVFFYEKEQDHPCCAGC